MKIKAFIALCFIIFTTSHASALTKRDSVRKGYNERLAYVLKHIGNTVAPDKIEFIMPVSVEESGIYFSSDYDDKLSKPFQMLKERIIQLAIGGNKQILVKYLYLSQFVDGYFAEDYFTDIEKIATAKGGLFCRTLASVDKNKIKRLRDVIKEHCK